MNAKKILLGAACAVGLCLSATAQTNPVYSVNAVGYVKVNLPVGFTMIANPLNAGTNNLSTLIPSAPAGSIVYKFASGGFDPNPPGFFQGFGWFPDAALNPGEGAFIYVPTATNVVFAGEVLQGTLTNVVASGFSILSSQVPQAAPLGSLGFPGSSGDTVYVFDPVTQNYDPNPVQFFAGFGWFPGDTNGPTIAPGASFWVFNPSGSKNWTRSFSVNP
jgi:hypothetical protein